MATPIPSDPHLASFPRPKDDNAWGWHWILDSSQQNIDGFGPVLASLGVKWTTVYGEGQKIVVDAAKQLYDKYGIVSVLRYEARQDKPRHPSDFAYLVQLALEAGIYPYVQAGNEPEIEFPNGNPKAKKTKFEAFANWWGSNAKAIAEAGGFVGLQTLDYEYLHAVLPNLSDAVKAKLFFVLHNYGLNNPPSFQPVAPTPGVEGSGLMECVMRFLVYAEWFKKDLGFVPPMIGGEGGWQWGSTRIAAYPKIDAAHYLAYNMEMKHWFRDGKLSNGDPLPDYLFSVCPWLLYASNWLGDSLVNGIDWQQKLLLVNALKNDPRYVRQFGYADTPPPPLPHICPANQHWDELTQKCVDDLPPPPPPDGTPGAPTDFWMDPRIPAGLLTIKWSSRYILHKVYLWDATPPDSPEARGDHSVIVRVVDSQGRPVPHVQMDWHTHDNQNQAYGWSKLDGMIDFQMTGYYNPSSANGGPHFPGPHDLFVGGDPATQLQVTGFGLALDYHIVFGLLVEVVS